MDREEFFPFFFSVLHFLINVSYGTATSRRSWLFIVFTLTNKSLACTAYVVFFAMYISRTGELHLFLESLQKIEWRSGRIPIDQNIFIATTHRKPGQATLTHFEPDRLLRERFKIS